MTLHDEEMFGQRGKATEIMQRNRKEERFDENHLETKLREAGIDVIFVTYVLLKRKIDILRRNVQ